jgi:hypothetical protein
MTIDASVKTDALNYNRISYYKNKIDDYLRNELKMKSDNIDWETEKITTETLSPDSFCKCGNRLIVTMTVITKEDAFLKYKGNKDKDEISE